MLSIETSTIKVTKPGSLVVEDNEGWNPSFDLPGLALLLH